MRAGKRGRAWSSTAEVRAKPASEEIALATALEADKRTKAVPLMTLHRRLEHRTITFVDLGDSAWRNSAQKIADAIAGFFIAFTRQQRGDSPIRQSQADATVHRSTRCRRPLVRRRFRSPSAYRSSLAMSAQSLSTFGAAGPMVGYLYQVRIALLWAIRRSRVGDFTVSIETLDDVSFEVGGQPYAVLQTKHSLNAMANLTDLSPEVWKTLRIWLVGLASSEVPARDGTLSASQRPTPPPQRMRRAGHRRNRGATWLKLQSGSSKQRPVRPTATSRMPLKPIWD